MLFTTDGQKIQVQHLFDTLEKYNTAVVKFLMRFDHYLEMLVFNADLVQEMLPGQVLDYMEHCKGKPDVPENCRIIAFPRTPKPHEIMDTEPWTKNHWK